MNITTGQQLERAVLELAQALGLEARSQVAMGKRIWGRGRRVDVVLRHPETGQRLGIECKYQNVLGSAEEKIPLTITDMEAWPIRGLVVLHGEGFSRDFKPFLRARGRIVEFKRLAEWLRFYFRLPREVGQRGEMQLNGTLEAQAD